MGRGLTDYGFGVNQGQGGMEKPLQVSINKWGSESGGDIRLLSYRITWGCPWVSIFYF